MVNALNPTQTPNVLNLSHRLRSVASADELEKPKGTYHKIVVGFDGKLSVEGFTDTQNANYDRDHRIEFKSSTLMDAYNTLRKIGSSQQNPSEYRFNPICQYNNAEMTRVNDEIAAERDKILSEYYEGDASIEDVKQSFIELARKNFQANQDNGYVIEGNQPGVWNKMIETFYSEFRKEILTSALRANNKEGAPTLAGHGMGIGVYYNSDFYYKSEDLIQAVSDAIGPLASEYGIENFQIPDYADKQLYGYLNFNTAWQNPLSERTSLTIKDRTVKPPRGFTWSFKDCCPDGTYQVDDSNRHLFYFKMSVSIKTEQGQVKKDLKVQLGAPEDDYFEFSDLFQFSDHETANASEVNQYLKNLRAYSDTWLELRKYNPKYADISSNF